MAAGSRSTKIPSSRRLGLPSITRATPMTIGQARKRGKLTVLAAKVEGARKGLPVLGRLANKTTKKIVAKNITRKGAKNYGGIPAQYRQSAEMSMASFMDSNESTT